VVEEVVAVVPVTVTRDTKEASDVAEPETDDAEDNLRRILTGEKSITKEQTSSTTVNS
jgi:hypothetical protein